MKTKYPDLVLAMTSVPDSGIVQYLVRVSDGEILTHYHSDAVSDGQCLHAMAQVTDALEQTYAGWSAQAKSDDFAGSPFLASAEHGGKTLKVWVTAVESVLGIYEDPEFPDAVETHGQDEVESRAWVDAERHAFIDWLITALKEYGGL